MRKSLVFVSPLLASLAFASAAKATTWYVSPTGTATDGCFSRDYAPCDLGTAANGAVAGDTVILADGVYQKQLYVTNTGTSSAWITFQADDCATPIIQGPGVGPADDNQDTGVGSSSATYVKFVGIVARGWSTGFGNGWVDTDATTSNGHFEFDDCLADGNGRTGFTFFSAQGIKIKNSIAAHNGSSTAHSWSSGITLYEAQGSAGDSWIEGNVSFENMDAQKHTDGSGFIIDEYSNGATFINNVAFRNGGSCLRLTKSSNCKFVNNTCYHDAQDSADTGPTNPSEVYFTMDSSNSTTTGTSFMNNVFVATGTGPGAMAIYNQPTSGWANNSSNTGSVSFFTGAEGNNPDFTLASGSTLAGKGGTSADVPTTDVGFDPKCITKKAPTPIGMMVNGSWWQYSIDYDYIKSIGGVAKCFNPKTRSGTPDIGAYANGAVTAATAGACPAPPPFGTMQGPGMGAGGAGGMSSGAGGMSTGAGGMAPAAGGSAGAVSTGGTTASGTGGTTAPGAGGAATSAGGSAGAVSTGGTTASGTGGTAASGSGGTTAPGAGGTTSTGAGGSTASGGGGTAPSGAAGSGTPNGSGGSSGNDSSSGCGCRVAGDTPNGAPLAAFGLVGLALFAARRRRAR